MTIRFGSMSPRQRDFARVRAFPASGGVAQVARATVTIGRYFLLLIAFCFAFFRPYFRWKLLQVYSDLISRLRLPKNVSPPISANATAHGQKRREQGYSPAMLIEESRIFQVVTFGMLHLHRSELDQRRLLRDVAVIADEADVQLMEAVRSLTWKS